jgi:hypothetical protein
VLANNIDFQQSFQVGGHQNFYNALEKIGIPTGDNQNALSATSTAHVNELMGGAEDLMAALEKALPASNSSAPVASSAPAARPAATPVSTPEPVSMPEDSYYQNPNADVQPVGNADQLRQEAEVINYANPDGSAPSHRRARNANSSNDLALTKLLNFRTMQLAANSPVVGAPSVIYTGGNLTGGGDIDGTSMDTPSVMKFMNQMPEMTYHRLSSYYRQLRKEVRDMTGRDIDANHDQTITQLLANIRQNELDMRKYLVEMNLVKHVEPYNVDGAALDNTYINQTAQQKVDEFQKRNEQLRNGALSAADYMLNLISNQ